ncbi:MAG: hypothetical protein AVDCRST_MAG56-7400 [uncultured Cytophagales bacterium]|uniref:Uncharacterized protein n=1 Tax=uncultured Cytophagales bacterium TaxID=158755 RepID=A0A6J4L429_9SPHI|nr:MAG: hypothetical protein AVDCRST_MAG56-7400 [uncultured Cytophagales bacterium]
MKSFAAKIPNYGQFGGKNYMRRPAASMPGGRRPVRRYGQAKGETPDERGRMPDVKGQKSDQNKIGQNGNKKFGMFRNSDILH